jgi:hypothetical protein
MRGVVHGFPKLDFERRPHFCSIRHKPHLGVFLKLCYVTQWWNTLT